MFGLLHRYRLWQAVRREKKKDRDRSPRWPAARDRYLKLFPSCEACGSKNHIQVHHIEPFRQRPDLELVSSNLIGLCMDRRECHLKIGHGGKFDAWNPCVRAHSLMARGGHEFVKKACKLAKEARLS